MSEEILDQYGRVTVYKEPSHPSPVYHVDGDVPANPYGNLAALLEDDALEEVMYNGGCSMRESRSQEAWNVSNQCLG